MIKFNNSWDNLLSPIFLDERYLQIRKFLKEEYSSRVIYPEMHNIFKCFLTTDYNDVKVVILGQDPYHEYGQAQGLSFSVPNGVKIPPSLVNIYKELNSDLNIAPNKSGDLTKWAERGVLLLNTVLTVREGMANSHKNCGWTWFTDKVISLLSERKDPIVFILWGGNARAKKSLINLNRHFIIESAHPSPLSAYNGFFGSKPFSKANDYLKSIQKPPIEWDLSK